MDWPFSAGQASRAIAQLHLAPPLRETRVIRYSGYGIDPPIVSNGVLFLKEARNWVARDERTHAKIWSRRWTGEMGTAPRAVWDGKLAVWEGDTALLLNISTGIEERRVEGLHLGWAVMVGDILVGWWRGCVYAADLRSARLLWRFDADATDNAISCEPCATDERVFVGLEDGSILALGLSDGQPIWRQRAPNGSGARAYVRGRACVSGDTVIFRVGGGGDVGVVALAASTGDVVWTFDLHDVVQDGAFYGPFYHVVGWSGRYGLLEVSTGRQILISSLSSTLPSTLATLRDFFPLLLSETHAWVGAGSGYLLAFNRETGEYAWHRLPKRAGAFQRQTHFTSVNGRLYYADMSARMYWLEEEHPTDPVLRAQRGSPR